MSIKDFYTKEYDSKPKKKPSKMEYKGSSHTPNEIYAPEAYSIRIVEMYGFPEINRNSFLFIDSETKFNEVCCTIDFYLEIMEGYNFDKESAIKIASDNTKLFMTFKEELERKINVLKEFALDREILIKNTVVNSINSKTLYNIVQYLKALGIEVTIKNIEIFYNIRKESIIEFNRLIEAKRKNYIDKLIALGCSEEEGKLFLEHNPYILKMDIGDLNKITAILWQYGLDCQMLTRSEELQKINPKVLYALTEALKSMNVEVTEENILVLYKKSDKETIVEFLRSNELSAGKMGVIYSEFYRR